MKTGPLLTQNGPQQRFFVPPHAPFLEIRTTLHSRLPYAEHFHSGFSLGLILAGRTCFHLNAKPYLARQGDIVLIAPGQAHSCNPIGGMPRSYHMLFIEASWLHERLCLPLAMTNGVAVVKPVLQAPALFSRLQRLIACAASGSGPIADELAALLLALNSRHKCFLPAAERPGTLLPAFGATTGARLAEERFPVSSLAKAAGRRRESFSRSFRKTAGMPPGKYLHCLRLEKARRMLQQGKSIAEAAIAAGYADQSHLHRMFVKFFSVTPGCYQKSRSHSYKK